MAICLFAQKSFPYMYGNLQKAMHIQECPNRKKEIQMEKVAQTSIVSVLKTLEACSLIP